jgi:hypothetical protein
MEVVLKDLPEISYIGGDIVPNIINDNTLKYGKINRVFNIIDITCDDLPDADLMIVRDCLQHFSFEDVEKFKKNLIISNIKFLLTTTYILKRNFFNSDIKTGDFRPIDIFKTPFNFPNSALERFDDYPKSEHPRQMLLFKVISLKEKIIK